MKTPYEILMGRSPNISFMRPFGCSLTILNTLDQLGKFDGKSEEGYLLGYSTSSKGFRVYNRVTRKVQDCLHVDFLENQENQRGKGPDWMFDLDLLTPSMNYIPVRKENYADSGGNVSTHDDVDDLDDQQFIVHGPNIHAAQNKPSEERTADKEVPLNAFEEEKKRIALAKGKECANSTFTLSTAKTPPQSTGNTPTDSDDDVPKDGVFSTNSFDDEHTDTEEDGPPDYNNMDHTIDVSSTPTHRIHKIHPQSQIIGKSTAGVQTRRKLKEKEPRKSLKPLPYESGLKRARRLLHTSYQCNDSQSLQRFFSPACCQKGSFRTTGDNHIDDHLREEAISWKKTGLICKQEQTLWLSHLQKQNMYVSCKLCAQNGSLEALYSFEGGYEMIVEVLMIIDPDLIGPLLQQYWATASLRVINDVPHIRAMVAGKKILISEETIRADLLFDDSHGVDCFPKQVIWDLLRDIGYEGLATNQKFNFSLMIMNGMLGHISNGTPFLMYPRFVQLFLNKQLEGVDRPQDFMPSVTLPSKIFTFMRKHSPKFSCRITPLTPSMLEVVTALAAEEEHSTSPHSKAASSARDAQGTPSQSAAQASISQGTADVQGTDNSQGTASLQGTAASLGTARLQGTAAIPTSPNDYTPTDASQTSGGDEGLLDIYALNREVRRLKKQTLSQAKQIIKLKAKLKKLSKFVQPVVKHHAFWVESQNLKKQKRRRKKQRKKVSSVKMGRNKEEGTLSEEHYDQEEDTADPFFDDIVDKDAAIAPDIDRKSNETEVLERKSDETEEINIEEKEASNVKSGDTEELDLEITQSTARQSTITPRTLNFEDEAGPSSPLRPIQVMESEEQLKVAEVLVAMSRPRGLSIPGSIQTQPQQSSQGTDPKDKGKGIFVEEPKKKKLTLQQIRALETTNDEEVARKIQAEWDAEEEGKRFEELKKAKPKTTLRVKPTSLAQERNKMMNFLKGQGYKNLQKLKYPQMKELYDKVRESIKDSYKDFIPMGSEKERLWLQERNAKRLSRKRKATISEEQPFKKLKLRTETVDEIRNYLRVVDFEKCAQERESLEGISMITELQVIDSPDGEYLIIHRGNNHFRAFDTLWEILHILDRQDLYHLYRVVQDYYEHIPPTGLGLILLGDLTTIWETPETSGDDFWKNQEDWEIVRWRLNESSGVHTLELEDGTMIHMLAERRYPLSRELMIRMLEHGMEVEDENETAITLIHLFILWTTEDGGNS
ncbi:putative ribonuclease H-like domain-containing protein [Tanacetum coccineum]